MPLRMQTMNFEFFVATRPNPSKLNLRCIFIFDDEKLCGYKSICRLPMEHINTHISTNTLTHTHYNSWFPLRPTASN